MPKSTNAVPAFGVQLQVCEDANGTNPITIAEVKDVNPTISAQIEDVTTHNTVAPWRTKIATLLNLGPVEFMVNFVGTDPTHDNDTGLLYIMRQREERTYRLVPSDGSPAWAFNALVASIKGGFPVAGVRSGSVTLEGTGEPDFAATA